MIIGLFALLTGIGVLFVVHPMATRRRHLHDFDEMFDFGNARERQYLQAKKAGVLENMKELDFEYETGKLSEEDYQRLRTGYLSEAHEIVEAIDKLQVQDEIKALIDSDVQRRRRTQ